MVNLSLRTVEPNCLSTPDKMHQIGEWFAGQQVLAKAVLLTLVVFFEKSIQAEQA